MRCDASTRLSRSDKLEEPPLCRRHGFEAVGEIEMRDHPSIVPMPPAGARHDLSLATYALCTVMAQLRDEGGHKNIASSDA
jgi:hypothetical protein